ncbi:hypothetical protein DEJ36_12485 [Curtobacterium sp. MCPF17_052]|nr:hypothetical protein [Curtobacterium sp. MCPF17_052]WIB14062.1 hypothetical protein DEJ36_12485 [Curtobacterium sp. MCPF17_052]
MFGRISRKTMRVAPLAGELRGRHEVAAAEGLRLGAEHTRSPCPAGDDDDRDDDRDAAVLQVRRDHDHERQARDHQEQVHDEADDLGHPAADVAPAEADRDGDERGQDARDRADHDRDAGAVDQLGEDVLAGGGGAHPVVGRRVG